ncbi:MAG: hypothetical protein A3E78_01860 [Alphaproteobacteria bacterium RIFCSPHIGHO2_12_FULL_63_12]|nr:MAG: hypothetical protein A3E78_01860 [Alphaproteobacteria bacterium RIFCSPHIGHO2_12_FULL_63_12]
MNYRSSVISLALLSSWLAMPAYAERLEGQYAKACSLTGTAGSVVVDVYDDTSATTPTPILATIPNGSVKRMGATDCYRINLATVGGIGYPAKGDPTEKHYTLVFRDDAANEIKISESVGGTIGPHPPSFICARETPVYPTIAIPSRGITSTVIANGNPNYVKVDVDCTRLFAGAEWTFYYVLSYDGSGRVSARTPSLTVPSP